MAEPITWAHRYHGDKAPPHALSPIARQWNDETGRAEPIIDPETGIPVREKIPQRGHDGDDDPRTARTLNLPRWVHYLRHDGHEARVPISMAGADVEGPDQYGKKVRAKARFFGWIPLGRCPIALLSAGELRPSQLAAQELRSVTEPCKPGIHNEVHHCPHYLAERSARRTRNNILQGREAAKFKSDADKILAGQSDQTKALVETLAKGNSQLAELIAAALKTQVPANDTPAKSESKDEKKR